MTNAAICHSTPFVTAYDGSGKNLPTPEIWDENCLEFIGELERRWQNGLHQSLPRTEVGWLEIFPEAKEFIPDTIRDLESAAAAARTQVKTKLCAIESLPDKANHWLLRAMLKYTFKPVRDLAFANKRIRSLRWLLSTQDQDRKTHWLSALNKARESNIINVAEHYGLQLRKSGATYKALCPIHAECTPSFHVYPPSRFVCFGCDVKGDVISLVQLIERCSFKSAVNKLQRI